MHFFLSHHRLGAHSARISRYNLCVVLERELTFLCSLNAYVYSVNLFIYTSEGADVVRLASIGSYSSLHRNLVPTPRINNVL